MHADLQSGSITVIEVSTGALVYTVTIKWLKNSSCWLEVGHEPALSHGAKGQTTP